MGLCLKKGYIATWVSIGQIWSNDVRSSEKNPEAIWANPIPAPELLQHLPWRWKTNGWLPMLKTRCSVQEAGDGHPGPWCLDFWGATCCSLESGNAGWSWKFVNHQRSYGYPYCPFFTGSQGATNWVSKPYDSQCQPQLKKHGKTVADHLNYSGLVPTSDDLFLYNVKYDTMRPRKNWNLPIFYLNSGVLIGNWTMSPMATGTLKKNMKANDSGSVPIITIHW